MGSKKLQIALPILFAMIMALGMYLGYQLREHSGSRSFLSFGKRNNVQEIIDLVKSRYVDDVKIDSISEIAINELLSHLDPHSAYIPASEIKDVNEDLMGKETKELLNRLKINIPSLRVNVQRMSGGQQQAVAIARAVAFQARVVIMDEPTAALAVKETGKVLDIISNLRENGVSVILISHRLQDVFNVADRIMVLRSGETIADEKIENTSMDRIVKYIVGG